MSIEQSIKEIAGQVFDERIGQLETVKVSNGVIDDATQERINTYELIARKPYLNRKETALYLDVSERSIIEWSNRPMNENPFPETFAGGNPRYQRKAIDEWILKERGRMRLRAVS